MRHRAANILIVCIALIASAEASAETIDRAYVGIRAGNAMSDRFDFIVGSKNADDPYGLFGGWNFSSDWSAELAYTTLGSTHLGNTIPVPVLGSAFQLDGRLLTIGAKYRLPLSERFSLFGAIGAFDLHEDGRFITFAHSSAFDNGDNGAYLEVGAGYRFDGPIGLRASYQWFDFDQGQEGTFWLGIELNFWKTAGQNQRRRGD